MEHSLQCVQARDAPGVGLGATVGVLVLFFIILPSAITFSLRQDSLDIRMGQRMVLTTIPLSSVERVECVSRARFRAWKNPFRTLTLRNRPLTGLLYVSRRDGWFNQVFVTVKDCEAMRAAVAARMNRNSQASPPQ